jgi:hypothetical protein
VLVQTIYGNNSIVTKLVKLWFFNGIKNPFLKSLEMDFFYFVYLN